MFRNHPSVRLQLAALVSQNLQNRPAKKYCYYKEILIMKDTDSELLPPENTPEEPKDVNTPEETEKQPFWRTILDYAVSIGIALLAAFLINHFILLNASIPSGSMENTIMTGDRVFGFRLAYLFSEPKRGDIVIFKYPEDESINYIKRIIGLPGETVTIQNGLVYIDDSETPLDEPYVAETPLPIRDGVYEVPDGCYFMMGDNRNHSSDSRKWGYVRRDQILAKAFLKYWKGFKLF